MGARSQRKGRAAELELSKLLREAGIPTAQAAEPESHGNAPDLTGIPGIHVECKRQERLNLSAAMEQSAWDSLKFGGVPCVFHRRNREPWYVTMKLCDWLQLYAEWVRHTDIINN